MRLTTQFVSANWLQRYGISFAEVMQCNVSNAISLAPHIDKWHEQSVTESGSEHRPKFGDEPRVFVPPIGAHLAIQTV